MCICTYTGTLPVKEAQYDDQYLPKLIEGALPKKEGAWPKTERQYVFARTQGSNRLKKLGIMISIYLDK